MAFRSRFTAEKKARLLELIAHGHTAVNAARSVGISRQAVWDHRNADPEFSAAYDQAFEDGTQTFEEEMRRRAVEGVTKEKGVYHQGVMIGKEVTTEYSDVLLIVSLKARRPEVYRERTETALTGPGGGPVVLEVRRVDGRAD